MANNYTQASFNIPCSIEQAIMAQEAITFITEADIAEGELLLSKPLDNCSLLEILILSIIKNHPDYDPKEPTFGQPSYPEDNYQIELETEVSSNGLAVYHGESLDLDHAIALTTAILSVFNLPHMVTITAAFTCSKPNIDEFGGMTIVVTKDSFEYQDGQQFAQQMNKAHKDGIKYALCKVTHENGDNSYTVSYLMHCKASEIAQDVALIQLASICEYEPDDGYFLINEAANMSYSLDLVTELSPMDYDMMSKHLPSFDSLFRFIPLITY